MSVQDEPGGLSARLAAEGLVIRSGVAGLVGSGPVFEQIRIRLERRLSAEAARLGAESLRFPPLMPRALLERSGYLTSFPHLAGTVFGFGGDESAAADQAAVIASGADWSAFQEMTDLALVPAACLPVYPALGSRGPLPPEGAHVDLGGSWVFRREPSLDPARRQAFRQHEMIRAGTEEQVLGWREDWAQRGLRIIGALGLECRLEQASDPFFGRRGRLLARAQREQALKFELRVDIPEVGDTAVASFNRHGEHFGASHAIRLHDGATAQTACLGFGHERVTLALLATHGLDPSGWPEPVNRELDA